MSLFLTPEEVQELTGYALPENQERWLRRCYCPYEISGNGRVIILRDTARRITDPPARLMDEAAIVAQAIPVERASGVYFLIRGGRVVYVGRSSDVRQRIRAHVATKEFDSHHVIWCDESEAEWLEKEYIRQLTPELNEIGKK